ncbi:glutamine--fructose-6-phosphate transaminase (isomerizing) [Aquirufa nivalisilvae]|uniref:Glutamine--fructose-6-phosphate aminotransferase [isomerizing] n=1 Tax=Aquirufa nivalisilvae TaxID=2516557 RepID=A0A2S2DX29_9BACT|nr:glutamine--fructose-6-phosphate transaminase (isomerizing) [Aquirufa nivalisilvae]AWL09974.1 Glutamine--fructose-6-phosphate transaminase (isomerizing) [Aquirufa nivalisilvae]MCZ2480603.1 glutamine--fructose-6-phosphate transaminase (isomerizing) [Aquirufa nivalisilvae]MCZ2482838.1 glutamine--fructose-6-phosphate transaminase (isomerizing) [Aquirufa nivalisilvae]
MCGIVAYIGHQAAYPIILKGLKRLEYRGYDSSGIALYGNQIESYKKKGRVSELETWNAPILQEAHAGIGHTRWATHGEPTDANAHPHQSNSGKITLVHNGIIENYASLKAELIQKGYTFKSETDTEVLVNFIEDIQINNHSTLEEAMRIALKRVVGAYVIIVLEEGFPDRLIAARKGSPLVIGVGEGEHFLASDASPIIEYTKSVIYVNDYELAIISKDDIILKNLGNEPVTPYIQQLDMELAQIEKGGFDHFMLKEIFDQPASLTDCLRGRLDVASLSLTLAGVDQHLSVFTQAKRIIIVACGTSWHAGLIAEYMIETICRIPVEVEYASEFRYRNPIIHSGDVIIAISQSGETADTLVAIERAKEQGAFIFGVVNAVGSSIARLSHAGAYTHAGPEIGVASTKAFTAQLTVLAMMALKIGKAKQTLTDADYKHYLVELSQIPEKVQVILSSHELIKEVAQVYAEANNFLFLGRGYNFPVALEAALKLKEVSYIPCSGYPSGEVKHGPIALVDETLPTLFIATKDKYYDKIVSNIQEIKARKGKVIAIINPDDTAIRGVSDHVMEVPETDELLAPLLTVIPTQLMSYYIGVLRGLDVDKPRNLAKSVTVE